MTINTTTMKRFIHRLPWSVIANLGLVYLCYAICRGIFIAVNHDFINGDIFQWPLWWQIVKGSFRFDSSAIFYTNILYLLLVLLPLHLKETAVMQKITKWVFVVVNSLCVIANLCDCVYYSFTQRRTTISVLQEFGNNDNIGSVVGIEMVHSWYLVVAAIALTALLWRCYTTTAGVDKWRGLNSYYINRGAWLLVFGAVAVMAMRGDTFKKSARPLAVNDAHQYVENPSQAGIVVNTPFSILRTAAKKSVTIPRFYASQREPRRSVQPRAHTRRQREAKPQKCGDTDSGELCRRICGRPQSRPRQRHIQRIHHIHRLTAEPCPHLAAHLLQLMGEHRRHACGAGIHT